MLVREIMSQPVELIASDDTILDAAKKMADCDCGALPVAENDRLVGMLTDRDIVTRAVAQGFDPSECFVREVMSPDIKYLYEDESIEDAARNMRVLQVKRLPVLNREKRLVGIVSLGDLGCDRSTSHEAEEALFGISQPQGKPDGAMARH
ncbi:MAG: CBS domain-containing protein [Gemmatimonas sp.]